MNDLAASYGVSTIENPVSFVKQASGNSTPDGLKSKYTAPGRVETGVCHHFHGGHLSAPQETIIQDFR